MKIQIMIIFGTKGVTTLIKTGVFDCPQCTIQKGYSHKKVKKYFTLYFIPLIPLSDLGEYVECGGCQNTFVTRVLEFNPHENLLPNYEKAVKESMIMMMLADGIIEESEKNCVLKIVNQNIRNKITMFQLENDIKRIQKEGQGISKYLKIISGNINESEKLVLLKCAFEIAGSDGKVDESEITQLKNMAKALEVSDDKLNSIINPSN